MSIYTSIGLCVNNSVYIIFKLYGYGEENVKLLPDVSDCHSLQLNLYIISIRNSSVPGPYFI